MRTVRCSGRRVGGGEAGGCLPAGGVCLGEGVSAQGRGCLGGVWSSACWDTHPLCEQNDRRLWKHNLSATMLLTVKVNKLTMR